MPVVQIVVQYLLVVILIVGLGYLVYLLKEKGVSIKDDYFGIANTILANLADADATPENIKNVLRSAESAVQYVETNYKLEDNQVKEDKALELAKNAISTLNLTAPISDEDIRKIIRLCCALMPPTNKDGAK